MVDNIFPNLAGSAFGGVVAGLELIRQRNDRRAASRRQRAQDAGLADLQGQLSRVTILNDDGSPRDQRLIDADRENILLQGAVNPAFDENTRNLIGTQARSLTANRERVGNSITPGSTSDLLFGSRGGDPAANVAAPDLGLSSPPASEPAPVVTPASTSRNDLLRGTANQTSVEPVATIAPPTVQPGVVTPPVELNPALIGRSIANIDSQISNLTSQLNSTTVPADRIPLVRQRELLQEQRDALQARKNRQGINTRQPAPVEPPVNNDINITTDQVRESLRNITPQSSTQTNRSNLREVADNVLNTVVASAQAASAAPETVAPAPPSVSNTIVTALPDAVSQRVIDVANNLIESGGFNISVQALVQLLEGRLRTLGVDVATITEEQFDQLASNGQLLTAG